VIARSKHQLKRFLPNLAAASDVPAAVSEVGVSFQRPKKN
jgi:hypothetical protein